MDHRGINPGSPVHALAHLGLARAYARADPDLPILQQAKAEYAKLK